LVLEELKVNPWVNNIYTSAYNYPQYDNHIFVEFEFNELPVGKLVTIQTLLQQPTKAVKEFNYDVEGSYRRVLVLQANKENFQTKHLDYVDEQLKDDDFVAWI
jgi:hypothetical protein